METAVYSHNPYHETGFPLLVLDVISKVCTPYNEGFRILHWHEEIQFVYVLKGIVRARIYDEEFEIGKGDCLFINRTVLHQILEKEDCHYHSFIIPVGMLAFFPGSVMEQKDVEAILNHPVFTHYLLRSQTEKHREVLRQMEQLDKLYFQNNRNAHQEYRISIQLAQLWLAFLELKPTAAVRTESDSRQEIMKTRDFERIRTLLRMVHTNYRQPLSVQNIADAAHISKTECVRCFRKFVHDSPYRYLLKYRLNKSLPLLAASELSVTEIALEVGFCSSSSYIKYFKMYYNMTPCQYRRNRQRDRSPGPSAHPSGFF